MSNAVFDPYWPPAANPIVPTSSGFYPYTAEEMWSGAVKKSCCSSCRAGGPCDGLDGLAGCSACTKDGSMLAGLALGGIGAAGDGERVFTPSQRMALAVVGMAATGAAAYHGYRRNGSVGWAIVWGFFGALAPIITVPVALAQGFGEPA